MSRKEIEFEEENATTLFEMKEGAMHEDIPFAEACSRSPKSDSFIFNLFTYRCLKSGGAWSPDLRI